MDSTATHVTNSHIGTYPNLSTGEEWSALAPVDYIEQAGDFGVMYDMGINTWQTHSEEVTEPIYRRVLVVRPDNSIFIFHDERNNASLDMLQVGISRQQSLDELGNQDDAVDALSTVEDERLLQISALSANWDSYGALPISPDAIREARNLVKRGKVKGLPVPFIAPGSDTGVGIEWKTSRGELYIDIVPGEKTTYALTLNQPHEEAEGDLDEIDFYQLLGQLKEVPSDIGQ